MAAEVAASNFVFDSLLRNISSKFSKKEKIDLINRSKTKLGSEYGSLPEDDLYPLLKKLQKDGRIDESETSLLENFYAEGTSNKQDVKQMIEEYKATAPPKKKFIVGRDEDIKELLKRFNNKIVRGVNLFGVSGVGKTILAQEAAKQFCDSNNFAKLTFDLRDIKDLKNVYFSILACFKLLSWDSKSNKNRILSHLKELPQSTLLVLDNVEQLLCKDSEQEKETREEFIGFISEMFDSDAAKNGNLKIMLTSRVQVKEPGLRMKGLSEFLVEPLDVKVSGNFITDRGKVHVASAEQEDKALEEIANLCRNIPYLLDGFAQMIREGSLTPQEVLMKVNNQLSKEEVPKQFACISSIFESLASEHIKQLAVKVALFRRPFPVSAAQKIADLPSLTDTSFDLDILAAHKLLTVIDSEDKSAERLYDIHAIFHEFVEFICDTDPRFKEAYKDGEKQFFSRFTEKLKKLSKLLENNFMKAYNELDVDRPNYKLTIDIASKKEVMGFLLYSDEYHEDALMEILFEGLKSGSEWRKLYHNWAETAEEEGNWLTSAQMRCWESIQEADLVGPHDAMQILNKAQESLNKAKPTATSERYEAQQGLYLYCCGRINLMIGECTTDKKESEKSLEQAISELEQSLEIRKRQLGDHTLTARTQNLIGNYYMAINKPEKAEKVYKEAMNMKIKLVGSELHWEIPTYYNQMAAVYEKFGKIEENKMYYTEAKEWIEKAIALQERLGVSETEHTATFQRNLANILVALGENDKALENAKKSYERRKEQLGTHPETVRIMYLIGIINEWRKDKKQALEFYEKAFEMEESEPLHNNHSPVRYLIRDRLVEMCSKLKKKKELKEYKARFKVINESEVQSIPNGIFSTAILCFGTVLHFDTSSTVEFLDPVTICVPHPLEWQGDADSSRQDGQIRLMFSDDITSEDSWKDVTCLTNMVVGLQADDMQVPFKVKPFSKFGPVWVKSTTGQITQVIQKSNNRATKLYNRRCTGPPVRAEFCVYVLHQQSSRKKVILGMSGRPKSLPESTAGNRFNWNDSEKDIYHDEEIEVKFDGNINRLDSLPVTLRFHSTAVVRSSTFVDGLSTDGVCKFLRVESIESDGKGRDCLCSIPIVIATEEGIQRTPLEANEFYGIPFDDEDLSGAPNELLAYFKAEAQDEILVKQSYDLPTTHGDQACFKLFYKRMASLPLDVQRTGYETLINGLLKLERKECGVEHIREKLETGKRVVETCLDESMSTILSKKVGEDYLWLWKTLDIPSVEKERIEGETADIMKRCYAVLQAWREREGEKATLQVLMEKMRKAGIKEGVAELNVHFSKQLAKR